ncbi:MAG: ABC transporter substrate-binding protein [Campylobacterota bacterium]|nr:ABC transporter substrate-binding protein [Campylobacterota bacterium]
MYRLFNYLLLNIFLSTLLFANSENLEKVSLQLQWKHQFEFAGFYIAKEKGYYKEAGVEVELRELGESVDVVDEVFSGRATFGTGYPSLILKKTQGSDIVLLSAILQSSPHVLVSLKSSGINFIEDFKNRKIMTHNDEAQTTSFISMLQSDGVNFVDMTQVPHSFNIDDLITKKVDISSVFASNELYILDKKGIEYDIWDPRDYGFDFYDVILFTSSAEVQKSPQRVKAFRDASLKGWKYAFENIDETVELILQNYNTQNKSKEALIYEAEVLKKLAYLDNQSLGHIDKNKIQRISDIYNLMGLAKNVIDMDEFIFTTSEDKISFSRVEREYLEAQNQITMCIDPSWMPFESLENGKHIGISADYFKVIEEKLGIPIKLIQTQSWSQSLQLAQGRACDILSMVMETPKRKEYLNFTEPYLEVPLVITTKTDVSFINDIGALKEEKVGIPIGYAYAELLKTKYPDLNIVEVENIEDGLQKVSDGKLFGYIGTLASVGYMFQTKYTGDLKITGKFGESWNLGIGVRNDDSVLLGILNKAVKSIDKQKHQDILNDWIAIKYEKGVDYTLVWQILALLFLVIVVAIYRNSILSDSNKNLRIAKQKADEKTLEAQQQKENFRYMLSTSMEAIGIYEDGLCVELNDSAVEMYGYDNKEQILGRSALDFVAPSSRDLVMKNIQAEYSHSYEINALKANGEEFPVMVKGNTYRTTTKVQRLVTVLDLSEFKKSEKALVAAKEVAEEATKAKADFLSNMSHEIRTPMNGIVGMLHLLGKTQLDEKQQEYISKIKTASNNLLYMINDVLDFSKLEVGKLKIHSVDFDMNRVVQNVKDLVEAKAREKGLDFKFDFLEEESLFYGDSLRLSQVLINLTNNAVKFTHAGEIKLSIEKIRDDIIRFSVKDTGIGISKAKQEVLFESFNQADSSITRKYGGSGLGLSISKELIELMGGHIWLVSEVDKGSKFIFELKLPKGDLKNVDKIDLHMEKIASINAESLVEKEDISEVRRDALFYELKEAVKTSRPKSCQPIIEKMKKYNFSDKDAKIFNDIQRLLKKYKFKNILELLDGKNEK